MMKETARSTFWRPTLIKLPAISGKGSHAGTLRMSQHEIMIDRAGTGIAVRRVLRNDREAPWTPQHASIIQSEGWRVWDTILHAANIIVFRRRELMRGGMPSARLSSIGYFWCVGVIHIQQKRPYHVHVTALFFKVGIYYSWCTCAGSTIFRVWLSYFWMRQLFKNEICFVQEGFWLVEMLRCKYTLWFSAMSQRGLRIIGPSR